MPHERKQTTDQAALLAEDFIRLLRTADEKTIVLKLHSVGERAFSASTPNRATRAPTLSPRENGKEEKSGEEGERKIEKKAEKKSDKHEEKKPEAKKEKEEKKPEAKDEKIEDEKKDRKEERRDSKKDELNEDKKEEAKVKEDTTDEKRGEKQSMKGEGKDEKIEEKKKEDVKEKKGEINENKNRKEKDDDKKEAKGERKERANNRDVVHDDICVMPADDNAAEKRKAHEKKNDRKPTEKKLKKERKDTAAEKKEIPATGEPSENEKKGKATERKNDANEKDKDGKKRRKSRLGPPKDEFAQHLLNHRQYFDAVEMYWMWQHTGQKADPLCELFHRWIYSDSPMLKRLVVASLPPMIYAYLVKSVNQVPCPGIEAVFLAIYQVESELRLGREVTYTMPSLNESSTLHKVSAPTSPIDTSRADSRNEKGKRRTIVTQGKLPYIEKVTLPKRAVLMRVIIMRYVESMPSLPLSSWSSFIHVCKRVVSYGYPFDSYANRPVELWKQVNGGDTASSSGRARGDTVNVGTESVKFLDVAQASKGSDRSKETLVSPVSAKKRSHTVTVDDRPHHTHSNHHHHQKTVEIPPHASFNVARRPVFLDSYTMVSMCHGIARCMHQHRSASVQHESMSAMEMMLLRARFDVNLELMLAASSFRMSSEGDESDWW